MNRRDFLKSCGYTCVGGAALMAIFQSCKLPKTVNGSISGSDIVVSVNEFEIQKKGSLSYHNYIILENESLKHPIGVFRLNEMSYSAVYLKCTHQGAELQIFGDKLQCPAHGAEFSNTGQVMSGPADTALRIFPVTIENKQLKISLKK